MKIALTLSLLANLLLATGLYQYATDYDSLLAWACEHGNGGHECGED